MSMNCNDFLAVAKFELSMESEPGYRACISSAYYGLYHKASGLLVHCPATTHAGLIDYLLRGTERKQEPWELMDLISIGAVLNQQKIKRKMADYDLSVDVSKTESQSSLDVADKYIKKIDAMIHTRL